MTRVNRGFSGGTPCPTSARCQRGATAQPETRTFSAACTPPPERKKAVNPYGSTAFDGEDEGTRTLNHRIDSPVVAIQNWPLNAFLKPFS